MFALCIVAADTVILLDITLLVPVFEIITVNVHNVPAVVSFAGQLIVGTKAGLLLALVAIKPVTVCVK